MRLPLLSSVFFIIFSSVFAADISVYQWVDDKGMVHYSHLHPTDIQAIKIEVRSAYPQSKETLKSSSVFSDQSEHSSTTNQQITPKAKTFEKNCKLARENKHTLSSFKNILVQDETGNETRLTSNEISEQLKLTKKNIAIYCLITE
jgi:hypothetical protein